MSARALARLVLLLASAGACAPGDDAATRPPNIVLILADDLGLEALAGWGGAYPTPAIDRLGERGLRFTACFSQPLCTPSRVQLMTGRYNHRNYRGFGYLDPQEVTFANLLREAGYATCVAGKWQLNGVREHPGWDDMDRPHQLGFDEYCLWKLTVRNPQLERYGNPTIQRNGETLVALEGQYGPDLFCDFVLDFIERHADEPFFVYYPMVLPHRPFWITPDHPAWSDPTQRACPDLDGDPELFPWMLQYLDANVGRIVSKLGALGLRKDTVVLFTSDNGTDRGIVSLVEGRPVAGGKGAPTDAGTRVPLVVSWPGHVEPGVCGDLVDFSDFLPTLCELGGARLPADRVIDGRSFAPQLRGESGDPRDWIFSHMWGDGRDASNVTEFVRGQRFKLYGDGRFFDLSEDPEETAPLSELTGEARARRDELAAALASVRSR